MRDSAPRHMFESKTFLVFSLLTANAPDIDILFLFAGVEAYFKHHRGFSHSIFLIPIWGAIPAALAYYISRKKLGFRASWLWFSGMVAVHVLLDWLTSYGTEIFWPISTRLFSANLFPIVDPILVILMALAAIFVAIKPQARKRIVKLMLIAIVGLTGLRIYSKTVSESIVRANSGVIMKIHSFADTETPAAWLNPTRYRVVTVFGNTAESYRVRPLSGEFEFQGSFPLLIHGDEHYAEIESFELSKIFLERAQLPVAIERGDELIFADLRYSANIGQNKGLSIYFPMENGKISGEPSMGRRKRNQ
mgnify:CR=1 FL=1